MKPAVGGIEGTASEATCRVDCVGYALNRHAEGHVHGMDLQTTCTVMRQPWPSLVFFEDTESR